MQTNDLVLIREARVDDAAAVTRVHDLAFGRSNESRLVEAIRRCGVPTISLVAMIGTRLVGHVLFSPVVIEAPGVPIVAMGLAPLAVLPEYQRAGIGSMLASDGLVAATHQGVQVVVVVGEPAYYRRFGFRPAREFGLRSEYTDVGDAFMACELTKGVLAGRSGLAKYLPEFADV